MVKPEELRAKVREQMQSICEKEVAVICDTYEWVYEATAGMPEEQREVIVEQSIKLLFSQMDEGVLLMQNSLKQFTKSESLDKIKEKVIKEFNEGKKDAKL